MQSLKQCSKTGNGTPFSVAKTGGCEAFLKVIDIFIEEKQSA